MKRFAVIEGQRVIGIFEAESEPMLVTPFRIEEVRERVDYPCNRILIWDEFGKRPALGEDKAGGAVPQVEGIGVIRLVRGQRTLTPHTHKEEHLGVIISGHVKVRIGEAVSEHGPSVVYLPANIEHAAEAVSDEAIWLSVFENQLKGKR